MNSSKKQAHRKKSIKEAMTKEKEVVFALDIGTRSVVGIVGVKEGDNLRVLAAETEEHETRAMLDGQVHDIEKTAVTVKAVRDKLETATGKKLENVSIAAAGRVLRTCRVSIEKTFDKQTRIDEQTLHALEVDGVQKAQQQVKREMEEEGQEEDLYYCVGHSVTGYYLNGYIITGLLGHRGKTVKLEILATFLPGIVVESLYAALEKSGLKPASLTLEPIAAINATIPEDLRLLNLALADIGAGTSDIALTKDGSVIAYGMSSYAGDEITEPLSKHFLVDFAIAEKIKQLLSTRKDSLQITDILGNRKTVTREEIQEVVEAAISQLADSLGERIIQLNGKAPSAVFLVGGGSRVPGLTEKLAHKLQLPLERVAVQESRTISNVICQDRKLSGPAAVTPLGIALDAARKKGKDFITATVNSTPVQVFRNQKITVADALVMLDYGSDELIAKEGSSCNFMLNGEEKTAKGGLGSPPEILVDNVLGNLDTPVEDGSAVKILPAGRGTDAAPAAEDFITDKGPEKLKLNGRTVQTGPEVLINGWPAEPSDIIREGDQVEIRQIETLEDLLIRFGMDESDYQLLVNGSPVEKDYELKTEDSVRWIKKEKAAGKNALQVCKKANETGSSPEGSSSKLPESSGHPEKEAGNSITMEVNGEKICLDGEKEEYIFVDIFDYYNFDLHHPRGRIVLKLNGEDAAYTAALREGDQAEIYWEE